MHPHTPDTRLEPGTPLTSEPTGPSPVYPLDDNRCVATRIAIAQRLSVTYLLAPTPHAAARLIEGWIIRCA
ncbi:hypothetical protein [Saccharopolyspora shandongensis]|uniref:hypothetical protein n=1 Tax=Saccharopolyspora shandongensis TaxID=418495 RepID=UPI003401B599